MKEKRKEAIMKRETGYVVHLILFLMLFSLSLPIIVTAAPEQLIALVIGNSTYSSGPLKNPVYDATDIATALTDLGFVVILKRNAGHREMEEAVDDFGNRLKRGGVGLFYYAGHGIQVSGVNYLIPVDARMKKELDIKYQALDVNKILDEMANANNGFNIVILDACRDNPFSRSFRNVSRGLSIVSSAPAGTFISYSTGPGQVAQDGEERNSPYTAALLKSIKEPGIIIEEVFKRVRQKLRKETGQVPWELSSLEGSFYFNPVNAGSETSTKEQGPKHEVRLYSNEPNSKKEVQTKISDTVAPTQALSSKYKSGTDLQPEHKKSPRRVASYSRTSWASSDVKFHLIADRGNWKLMVSSIGKSSEIDSISRKVFAKKDAERKAKIALLEELAKPPFNLIDSVVIKLFDERADKDLQYLMDSTQVVIKFEIILPETI